MCDYILFNEWPFVFFVILSFTAELPYVAKNVYSENAYGENTGDGQLS